MIAQTLLYLFPGIKIGPGDVGDECVLSSDAVLRWNRSELQPTPEEIEAAYPAAQAAAARAAIPAITRAQAKAALIVTGMISLVQPAIDAIEDPLQRALAQNDWDERLHFERNNPTLAAMAAALGMTDAQLDDLFALAATL